MEENMSNKTRTALLIGGLVLGSIIVCGAIAVLGVFPLMGRAGYGAAPAAVQRAEDFAMEAPAAEPMAEEAMEGEVFATAESAPSGVGGGGNDVSSDVIQQQVERLIIRNGNIAMTVRNTLEAKAAIEQRVASLAGEGAFVVQSNVSESGREGNPYVNMSVRVPAERFDETMDWLEGLAVEGTNPTVSESAQDVTEEYVDVSARVESLEAARDRLLQLMEDARTTQDLLLAEQQLTQREAEIESLQGRLRYLSESAQLSRIDIQLQPYILSQPVDARWHPLETVREAFEALVEGLQGFGDFLIFFTIAVLPFLALLAVAVFGVVRFVTWRVRVGRRKRAAREAELEE
jgi:hypothetical protein